MRTSLARRKIIIPYGELGKSTACVCLCRVVWGSVASGHGESLSTTPLDIVSLCGLKMGHVAAGWNYPKRPCKTTSHQGGACCGKDSIQDGSGAGVLEDPASAELDLGGHRRLHRLRAQDAARLAKRRGGYAVQPGQAFGGVVRHSSGHFGRV